MKGWVLALVGVGLPMVGMLVAWRAWSTGDDPVVANYTAPKQTVAKHSTVASRAESQPKIARSTTAMLEGFDGWVETWSERIEKAVNQINGAKGASEPTAAAS